MKLSCLELLSLFSHGTGITNDWSMPFLSSLYILYLVKYIWKVSFDFEFKEYFKIFNDITS